MWQYFLTRVGWHEPKNHDEAGDGEHDQTSTSRNDDMEQGDVKGSIQGDSNDKKDNVEDQTVLFYSDEKSTLSFQWLVAKVVIVLYSF